MALVGVVLVDVVLIVALEPALEAALDVALDVALSCLDVVLSGSLVLVLVDALDIALC